MHYSYDIKTTGALDECEQSETVKNGNILGDLQMVNTGECKV